MPLPKPEIGLVIQYGYVWEREAQRKQEEGKDRPCLIVDVERRDGKKIVTVQPITKQGDKIKINTKEGVEIPQATKQRLGLNAPESWVITSEANQFVWPGHDLTTVPRQSADRFDYGSLPEKITNKVIDQAQQHMLTKHLSVVDRDTSPPKIENPHRRSTPEPEQKPGASQGPEPTRKLSNHERLMQDIKPQDQAGRDKKPKQEQDQSQSQGRERTRE